MSFRSSSRRWFAPPRPQPGPTTASPSASGSPALSPLQRTLAICLGNAVEWFDFAVYGSLAASLGRVFFPDSDPGTALLQSFAVFAVGFLMRPLGSLVLGPIGDRIGCRPLLLISVLMMAVASTLIGILPGHRQWGAAAGGLLILLRMVQGFSLGGEFTGSVIYVVESAAQGQRGRLGSQPLASSFVGLVAGSLLVTLVQASLPAAALDAWGWRLPFLMAGALGLVSLWLRRGLPERPHSPLPALPSGVWGGIRRDRNRILQGLVLFGFEKVSFYLVFVFWVQQAVSLDPSRAAGFNGLATLVQALGIPLILLAGCWADRWGAVRMMRLWLGLLLVLVVPAMLLLQRCQLLPAAAGLLLAGVPLMLAGGSSAAVMPFLFDAGSRCTTYSLSYSLGGSVLAGTAPAVAAWMVVDRGWSVGPLVYVLLLALPALLVLLRLQDGPEGPVLRSRLRRAD